MAVDTWYWLDPIVVFKPVRRVSHWLLILLNIGSAPLRKNSKIGVNLVGLLDNLQYWFMVLQRQPRQTHTPTRRISALDVPNC